MKKCILTILASLICLFLFADISSTATGGDRCWNTPATWIGGIIPGANDNVIINSSVRACNNYCNNLSITASGILENYNTSMWLQVNGDLENHGTIRNSNASTMLPLGYTHSWEEAYSLGSCSWEESLSLLPGATAT